jgi:hypothetical protein
MQKSKMLPDRPLWQTQARTHKEARKIDALGLEPAGPWQNQMRGIDALGLEPGFWQNRISPRRSPGRTGVTQPESEEKHGETIAMLKQEQKKMLADDDKDDDDIAWMPHDDDLFYAHQESMPKPRQKAMPKQNANGKWEPQVKNANGKWEVKKCGVGPDEDVEKRLRESLVEKILEDVEDRIYFLQHAEGLKREWVEQKTEGLKREKRRLEHKKQQLLEHNRQQLDVAASSSSSSSWMMAVALGSSSIQKPVTK